MCSSASFLPPPLRVAEPIPLPKSGKGSHPIEYFYSWPAMHPTWCMAERVGFEPTSPYGRTAFRERRLKPLGNLSEISLAAKYFRPLTFSSNLFPFLLNLILNLIFSSSSASTLTFVLPSSFLKKCFQYLTAFLFKNTSVNFYFVI
jgi:hypothetical protein